MKTYMNSDSNSVLVKMKVTEWEALQEFAWNLVTDFDATIDEGDEAHHAFVKIANA